MCAWSGYVCEGRPLPAGSRRSFKAWADRGRGAGNGIERREVMSASERSLQVRVREAEVGNCVLERLTIGEPVQQPRPPKPRTLEHDAHRQQAFVVRHLRPGRAQVPEAV